MSLAFLAFDLGAESGRAAVGRLSRGALELREVARFANTPVILDGTLRWDVEAIWRNVSAGLEAAVSFRPSSIGVDTWGVDYGLLDGDGALVEPPYHYRDHRTDGVMAEVFARVGRERVYDTTGVQCMPINTLYQIYAASRRTPDVVDRARRLLTMPDLINMRLTGRAVSEFTNATTTQCLDGRTRTWARDLLSDLGVPVRLFGPIVDPGTTVGGLSANASAAMAGTPVVAPACHDTGSAVASVHAGGTTAFLSSGTWSLVGTEVGAPVITARSRDLNFTNEGGVAGTTRLLKNVAGLWLLQACRRQWAGEGVSLAYDDLVAAAAEDHHAFQAIVDPDDPSFLSPDNMVAAIASYCERTGQPQPASPAGYARTIFESLALKYRVVIDALESITGTSIQTIRVVGGGAKNHLLNAFTASATGRTVLAGPVEATALGNIAMQMVATGAVSTIAEARDIIDRSYPPARYEPVDAARWAAPYRLMQELCGAGGR